MMKFKRLLLFVFIFLYAFPSEAAHAISFIPDLIKHYHHHNDLHHPISFVDFLNEHSSNSDHDKKHDHHEQDHCPINHNHSTTLSIGTLDPLLTFEFLEKLTFSSESKLQSVNQNSFCHSGYIFSVWQPPRI